MSSPNAIVSMVSGGQGFLLGAMALGHSLDKHAPGFRKILMVEQGAYTDGDINILRTSNWELQFVPAIRSRPAEYDIERWPQTFTKINVWNIDAYKVLYLDADCCAFTNEFCPWLFDIKFDKVLAAKVDYKPSRKTGWRGFNAGIMVLRPNKKDYEQLKLMAETGDPEELGMLHWGDQGVHIAHFGTKGFTAMNDRYNWRWWGNPEPQKGISIGHLRPHPWAEDRHKHAGSKRYVEEWDRNLVAAIGHGRTREIVKRIKDVVSPVGVEVGVFDGVNAGHILNQVPSVTWHMVDHWKPVGARDINRDQAYWDEKEESAKANTDRWASRRVIHKMTSIQAAAFADNQFDLVFIDADHSYESVQNDIAAWLPKVKLNGWIGGHDYSKINFPGVCRAVDEAFSSKAEFGLDDTWWVRM